MIFASVGTFLLFNFFLNKITGKLNVLINFTKF